MRLIRTIEQHFSSNRGSKRISHSIVLAFLKALSTLTIKMPSLINYLVIFVLIELSVAASSPFILQIRDRKSVQPDNEDTFDIFIKMSQDTNVIIEQVIESQYSSRNQRLNSLFDKLTDHADKTQKKILEYLLDSKSNSQLQVRRFWATNQIYVKGATRDLIRTLETKFPADIHSIYPNQIIAHIAEPIMKNVSQHLNNSRVEDEDFQSWGLPKIQTREAWKELATANLLKSTSEIRIATIDTGVRHTHNALRDNFLGQYGWFDPTIGEPQPEDRMGHGTHTTGTIAGSKGIGVAPWVKWMSCRACPTMGCSLYDLLACGEFMLCPTLTDGSSPDCSKAPHLVSNSWSGGQGLDWYNDVIAAWRAAGIIPIFSIGNFGNAFCGTANYPGDLSEVIAVGSTTIEDTLSWFGSIGPTLIGGSLIKPDVVAPGSDILSATSTADDDYVLMSGTSMSCPHVSGIVALLFIQNPQLTFDEAKRAILISAQQDLQSSRLTCQGIPDTVYPNHVFGFGRANALLSLRSIHTNKS